MVMLLDAVRGPVATALSVIPSADAVSGRVQGSVVPGGATIRGGPTAGPQTPGRRAGSGLWCREGGYSSGPSGSFLKEKPGLDPGSNGFPQGEDGIGLAPEGLFGDTVNMDGRVRSRRWEPGCRSLTGRGFQPIISNALPSVPDPEAAWGGGCGVERSGWVENTEAAPLEGMWVWGREEGRARGGSGVSVSGVKLDPGLGEVREKEKPLPS